MKVKFTMSLILIILSNSLAGCLSSAENEYEQFPSFNFVDEQENNHNESMYENASFVAYFSASWCSHCKPVLGSLDDIIPEGQLLVFNIESREQYSDMNEWKDRMESELERDLLHPFIHAPPLAQTLEVSKIPTVFFVNSDGEIVQRPSGLTDKATLEDHWNSVS
jgi:thiol-disulfide isomerase/thioredoxin